LQRPVAGEHRTPRLRCEPRPASIELAVSEERAPASRHHESSGPGPFVTRVVIRAAGEVARIATSRRHRKRLAPRPLAADGSQTVHRYSWLRAWAPARLAWWIALLFVGGAGLFSIGGALATFPGGWALGLDTSARTNAIFFVGSIFFTAAACLQLLESINNDVTRLAEGRRETWRWIGWRPKNLGYLASLTQFVGTLLFNANTYDAMLTGLSRAEEDVLVWGPNILGSVLFMVSGVFAAAELVHRPPWIRPRDVSWWIVVINLAGCVAFLVSALYSYLGPGEPDPGALWTASLSTFCGALCFLVASYLLLPEMFEEQHDAAPAA
jgi:hypothetical protein